MMNEPLEKGRLESAVTVKVVDVIHTSFATSTLDSAKVYEKVKEGILSSKDVNLDWDDISMVTPSFLLGIVGPIRFDFDGDRKEGIFFTNFKSSLGEEFFFYMVALDNIMKLASNQLRELNI